MSEPALNLIGGNSIWRQGIYSLFLFFVCIELKYCCPTSSRTPSAIQHLYLKIKKANLPNNLREFTKNPQK